MRVSPPVWIKAVMSQHGPRPERMRHTCQVLERFMRGDGVDGCFPSQRTVGAALGVDHKIAGRRLAELQQRGWLEVEEIRRQYGRVGRRYFGCVPDELTSVIGDSMKSPIRPRNGDTRGPQSAGATESPSINGDSARGIGDFPRKIGDSRGPLKSSSEISTEGAASPSPAAAGSAALAENVLALHQMKYPPERIVEFENIKRLGGTLESVRSIVAGWPAR